jgi:hypothetical protein
LRAWIAEKVGCLLDGWTLVGRVFGQTRQHRACTQLDATILPRHPTQATKSPNSCTIARRAITRGLMIEGFCGITFNAGQTMGFWPVFVSNSHFMECPLLLPFTSARWSSKEGPCWVGPVPAGISVWSLVFWYRISVDNRGT